MDVKGYDITGALLRVIRNSNFSFCALLIVTCQYLEKVIYIEMSA